MRVIHKYMLEYPEQVQTRIDLPLGSHVVRAAKQGLRWYIWVLHDKDAPRILRTFRIFSAQARRSRLNGGLSTRSLMTTLCGISSWSLANKTPMATTEDHTTWQVRYWLAMRDFRDATSEVREAQVRITTEYTDKGISPPTHEVGALSLAEDRVLSALRALNEAYIQLQRIEDAHRAEAGPEA